jgi:glycosyltransferase involved in cell wall biosynthesis
VQGFRALAEGRGQLILVGWSHLVLLPIVLMGFVWRHCPPLVLYGFIYTQRRSRFVNWCRRLYFRVLLSRLSLVICHSRHECEKYRQWLGRGPRFTYMPFCVNVGKMGAVPNRDYAVSAGRSGRDYALLRRVFAGLEQPLKIICDHFNNGQAALPPNVEILRGCYDGDYLRELAGARLVIVPLSVEDVSAGQMVLLQAMALGKPIIVTETATTREYVTNYENGILVPRGDEAKLCEAVRLLLGDAELSATLGANAKMTYDQCYSIQSEARYLLACLEGVVGRAGEHVG